MSMRWMIAGGMAKWASIVLLMLAMYVLSFGPFIRLRYAGWVPQQLGRATKVFYSPLEKVGMIRTYGSEQVNLYHHKHGDLFGRYVAWWARPYDLFIMPDPRRRWPHQ